MSQTSLDVRTLTEEDRRAAVAVINEAARWYAEVLPSEEVSDTEMTAEEWDVESQRMTWFGAFAGRELIGVIGLEYVENVALLRHWYVLPDRQRHGAGSRLREHLERSVTGVERIVAGTYGTNYKARGALERAGYRLSPDPLAVLDAYYDIPPDRRASSVTYELNL